MLVGGAACPGLKPGRVRPGNLMVLAPASSGVLIGWERACLQVAQGRTACRVLGVVGSDPTGSGLGSSASQPFHQGSLLLTSQPYLFLGRAVSQRAEGKMGLVSLEADSA
jgi:hypothetical protein